jgi:uncharacterized membrane protein YeaQ/YmgE (transglycosylase-associated protein family)
LAPWLSWIFLGLIAGSLAKFLVPGRDPPGCLVTIALGIAGAFVGGLVATTLGWGQIERGGLDVRSVLLATLGAVAVLLAGRALLSQLRRRPPPRPPDAR